MDLKTAIKTIQAWLKTSFYSNPENEEIYLLRYFQTVKFERIAYQL